MVTPNAILLAYAVTICSEIVLILALQRLKNVWRWLVGVVLINSFTHPIAIYLLHIQNANYVLVELGVLVLEAIWYKAAFQGGWKRSFTLSGVANISSILVGIGIRSLFGL